MANVYNSAADVMAARGWCRGELQNLMGNVCLAGAINLVMNCDATKYTAASHAVLMKLAPYTDGMHPVHWNNLSKAEEVIAMLRRAHRGELVISAMGREPCHG